MKLMKYLFYILIYTLIFLVSPGEYQHHSPFRDEEIKTEKLV